MTWLSIITTKRLDKFYQAILHYGEEQRKKIEEEVAAFKQKELDEAEIGVLTEAYHLIQKEMAADAQRHRPRIGAAGDGRPPRSSGAAPQNYGAGVFPRGGGSSAHYTQKPEYAALLQTYAAAISPLPSKRKWTVHPSAQGRRPVPAADCRSLWAALHALKPIPPSGSAACALTTARWGSWRTNTLDAMLEDQRGWFEENSGLTLAG